MTSEQLIDEGRKLQRPCVFLRPQVNGPIAAIWHERVDDEVESTGHHCWITVDARYIPNLASSTTGYVSVFSDEENCEGGRVEILPSWPKRAGTPLYAHTASVLPPIEAVFAKGSEAVGEWIRSHGWERTDRYNNNFKGADVVREYYRLWQNEFPIYLDSDIHAVLGGWHFPMADDDWYDLLDEHLMIFTLQDSEPWIEAWQLRTGKFKVLQRTS